MALLPMPPRLLDLRTVLRVLHEKYARIVDHRGHNGFVALAYVVAAAHNASFHQRFFPNSLVDERRDEILGGGRGRSVRGGSANSIHYPDQAFWMPRRIVLFRYFFFRLTQVTHILLIRNIIPTTL
jgi:hypothetical protein